MTRIIGWFSFMAVGAAGVVSLKNSHEFLFLAVGRRQLCPPLTLL
jgi:hypothetical protein